MTESVVTPYEGFNEGSALLAERLNGEAFADFLAPSVNRERHHAMAIVRAARFVRAIPSEAAQIEYANQRISRYSTIR